MDNWSWYRMEQKSQPVIALILNVNVELKILDPLGILLSSLDGGGNLKNVQDSNPCLHYLHHVVVLMEHVWHVVWKCMTRLFLSSSAQDLYRFPTDHPCWYITCSIASRINLWSACEISVHNFETHYVGKTVMPP